MRQNKLPQAVEVKPLRRGDPALVHCLTQQEYEVYLWLLRAYSIEWIAESMGLEKRTVKNFARNIYTILKVSNQRELVRYYFSPNQYTAKESQTLHGEALANSMACYTDQCAMQMNNEEQ
jgi:DNA-binding CsgD family transcriptional regulator